MSKEVIGFWTMLKGNIDIYEIIANSKKTDRRKNTINQHKNILIEDQIIDLDYQTGLDLILANTINFRNLFKVIFLDFDKFKLKKTKSVNPKFDLHLIDYNNRYKLLSDINLYSHTINVVIETIKISQNIPQDTKDIAILLALLHDMGKNSNVVKEFKYEANNETAHHKISANYAKYIMHNEMLHNKQSGIGGDLIELVYTTLRSHHEKIGNKETNLFLELLIDADTKAREIELNGILMKKKKEGK